jgi:uncharacterized protein with NAD-binding domain and iron-sulfur cluster
MTRQRIAILGGGIAGLSTAYQLSRTQELRDRFEVTVYQMGWRLGGKIASGRDATGRNLEHGLHVWFGCYDNAFAMLKEVYAARQGSGPLAKWTDALKPQPFTPIGTQTARGWTYLPVTWPPNDKTPGEGGLSIPLWDLITELIGLLRHLLESLDEREVTGSLAEARDAPPVDLGLFLSAASAAVATIKGGLDDLKTFLSPRRAGFLDVISRTHLWAQSLHGDLAPDAAHVEGIFEQLEWLRDAFRGWARAAPSSVPGPQLWHELLDLGYAFIRGIWDDVLLPDRPFEALDELDFRAWLKSHGADARIVAESSLVRALYDTAFQYVEGDATRPSYAAGTAAGVMIRLIATYKGAMMWELQAGIGEAVIAPLYESLLRSGVQFRFFRKVARLELSDDFSHVERVRMDRQADFARGDYTPTFPVGGVTCWPSEPSWAQLCNGEALRAAGVNFESHWCKAPPVGQETLQLGTDFDTVVLAISMGAYKPLNDESGMCDEMIARTPRFADFVRNIPIVPTQSVQLWCDVTTAQLGWQLPKPAAVAGPEYLSIWADMTQVLGAESWGSATKSGSLHYLTGTFATPLYKEPSTYIETPTRALCDLKAEVVSWLEHSSVAHWPLACDGTSFRWEWLTDPANGTGATRLDAQYLRANISPTECCVGSPAGSTKFRLLPDQIGFGNLFLAGEAMRTGCNTSSVEGAVMSGFAAARAISGQPEEIVGYDFLRLCPSQFVNSGGAR